MNSVTIFCDGSVLGNPGPGGWGVIVSHLNNKNETTLEELGGFVTHTTNNRMELTAAIEGLKKCQHESVVTIKTDSQYVINGVTKWVFGWEKNGWQTKEKKEVLNKDLWEELVQYAQKHTVTWEHVRAHTGVMYNERVDMIAIGFARKEKVNLFKGSEKAYTEFLKSMPKPRSVSSSTSKKGKAFSYVSQVDGVVMTHATWTECEKRVRGKKAKFKKSFSADDEKELIALWST